MREPPWKRQNLSSGFEGDVAIVELRARLALAPDHIPEPVVHRAQGSTWGVASRLICIAALAAGGSFTLLELYAPPREGLVRTFNSFEQPAEQPASPDLKLTAVSLKGDLAPAPQPVPPRWVGGLASWPAARNGPQPVHDLATNTMLPVAEPPPIPPPQAGEEKEGARATAAQDEAKSPEETNLPQQTLATPPAAQPAPDRNEIAALVSRGAKYFASGDIAAARLVLRPAALAGDSGAALALGETYDPVILKRLGVIGFPGDLAEARTWYGKAAELGSPDAPHHLDQLAGLDH